MTTTSAVRFSFFFFFKSEVRKSKENVVVGFTTVFTFTARRVSKFETFDTCGFDRRKRVKVFVS